MTFFRHAVALGSALAATLAGSGPLPVHAADAGPERPSLAVVGVPLQEDKARAAAVLVERAEQIARSGGAHDVQSLPSLVEGDAGRARQEKAEAALRELALARKQYVDLNPQSAANHCDRALALFEASDLSRVLGDMISAWTLKIASLVANADTRTALVELGLLLQVAPKTPLDPTLFSPDFIAQARRKRDEVAARSTLSLDIATRPAAARVYLDGVFQGVVPVQVRSLSPGDHFVSLVAAGYQFRQFRVRPTAGGSTVETLEALPGLASFEAVVARIARRIRQGPPVEPAEDLARQLGVSQVVVLAVGEEGSGQLHVTAYRIKAGGGVVASARGLLPGGEAGLADSSADLLRAVISTEAKTAGGGGLFSGTAPRKRTGYLLAGAGGVALVGGVIAGLTALGYQEAYDDPRVPQTNPQLEESKRSGQTWALVADILIAGALAMAGTGIYLVISDSDDRPAKSPASVGRTQDGPGRGERSEGEESRSAPRSTSGDAVEERSGAKQPAASGETKPEVKKDGGKKAPEVAPEEKRPAARPTVEGKKAPKDRARPDRDDFDDLRNH